MPIRDQTINTAREFMHRTRYGGEQRVLTGRRLDNGEVTLDGAPPGHFWVRSTDYSRELRAVIGYVNQRNVPVLIAPDAVGNYYLVRVDAAMAQSQTQVIQYVTAVAPPPSTEVQNLSVGLEGFKPGRAIAAPAGGLRVLVDSFWTKRGRVPAQYVPVSPPTTPGTHVMARLAYDEFNEQFVQIIGPPTDDEVPSIEDVPVVPKGLIPLDTVWIAAGQTEITTADYIISSRQPLDVQHALEKLDATSPPTTSTDSTLGFEVGSLWHNRSDLEIYVCLDPAPGAATWALLAASDDPGSVGPGVISTARYGQALVAIMGALKLGRHKMRIYNLLEGRRVITKVFARLEGAPAGNSLLIDIHKNGTTIFTNQAHRVTIASGQTEATVTTIDVPNWENGEYLDVEIDQIGSTAGSDLTLHIVYHS